MMNKNTFGKSYLATKKVLQSEFSAACNFLNSIEALHEIGFYFGTNQNMNLYFEDKFLLHIGIGTFSLDFHGKPNGALKKGTYFDSILIGLLVNRLNSLGKEVQNSVEIYNDKHATFNVLNTGKAPNIFNSIYELIVEYGLAKSAHSNFDQDIVNVEFDSLAEVQFPSGKFYEGIVRHVQSTVYERNAKARKACLDFWSYSCHICGFDFERTYGAIGRNFIHVHHLVQLSSIKKAYEIDPVKDLRPVCPNCHSMLHRNGDAMEIEELRKIIVENKRPL